MVHITLSPEDAFMALETMHANSLGAMVVLSGVLATLVVDHILQTYEEVIHVSGSNTDIQEFVEKYQDSPDGNLVIITDAPDDITNINIIIHMKVA